MNLHFLTARQRYHIMHLSISINFPSKIYMSNDLLLLSTYKYTSNMLFRSINIKPSPRLFASIAPNTQPVAANTSNQSSTSTSTSTKKGSRLRKPALSLDQVRTELPSKSLGESCKLIFWGVCIVHSKAKSPLILARDYTCCL